MDERDSLWISALRPRIRATVAAMTSDDTDGDPVADPVADPLADPLADFDTLRFAPATRVLRRSAREIQIERGGSGVIVADLPEFVVATLHRRPAPASPPTPFDEDAREAGGLSVGAQPEVDAAEIARVLRSLTHAGYLVRCPVGAPAEDEGARAAALEPDLAALDDRFGARSGAVLDRRYQRSVRVHGTGRLAAATAALLAAAGVGQVHVPDTSDVALSDALPGGLRPGDEGQRTAFAAGEAVRRARAGAARTGPTGPAFDLLVSTDGYPVDNYLRIDLEVEPRPLLISGVWGSRCVVGPLIVAGRTSCLRCADLHRSDRDPAWPVLADQLVQSRRSAVPSEVAVCTLTAAITAVQALAFLDGERPATADGTLEFTLPDWRIRRRHWPRHADCACAR